MVAAPASGSGKTLITLGLLRAFRNRGLNVASTKVGPDYIDPGFHSAASGRPCFNLDPWAMSASVIAELFPTDCDLVIVEGVMGLFDGPQGARGSSADLAEDLGLPVILVVDARHQSQSIAALVHGFATYRPKVQVAGVILNRVASPRHDEMLRAALGDNCLGSVPENPNMILKSRHLGLIQSLEYQELDLLIEEIALTIGTTVDLNRLLELAGPVAAQFGGQIALPPLGQKIAVAHDRAFAFAYPHQLHHWKLAGAEISFFSPLTNEAPDPVADAVFLPGGYPELHAGQLAANGMFLNGLRAFKGLIYGECGGFMVLGDALIDAAGTAHPMAGLLPLTTSFQNRRLHLGYRQLTPLPGSPWTKTLRGHEFHYSTIANAGAADRLFAARDAAGNALPDMGLRCGKVMGSYAHIISEAP